MQHQHALSSSIKNIYPYIKKYTYFFVISVQAV